MPLRGSLRTRGRVLLRRYALKVLVALVICRGSQRVAEMERERGLRQ